MCVDDRCTIVTSTPFSYNAPQMSKAELFDPTTTRLLARVGVGAGMCARVVLVAAEDVLAGKLGDVGLAGHAGGQHQVPSGAASSRSPSRSTSTVHSSSSS